MKTKSNDGKVWATARKKSYGYLVLFGRTRDGRHHGHFEVRLPGNNLGTVHQREFIKQIRLENKVLFSDSKAKTTRTISLKINAEGAIGSFNFVERQPVSRK